MSGYRGGLDENDDLLVMGALLSSNSGFELMQNCDLPPPLKVFSGLDKMVVPSRNRVPSMIGKKEDDNNEPLDAYTRGGGGGSEDEKLELLKALRLSQTRAREAESKAASLAKERDCLSNALLKESTQLFAYRQWVRLLEIQVTKLQAQTQWQENKLSGSYGRRNDRRNDDGVSWIDLALTFCIGIAGVGVVIGCTYLI